MYLKSIKTTSKTIHKSNKVPYLLVISQLSFITNNSIAYFLLGILLVFIPSNYVFSFTRQELKNDDTSQTNTILKYQESHNAIDIIKGDTATYKKKVRTSLDLPGTDSTKYSDFQNRAFFEALKINIPPSIRLNNDIKLLTAEWQVKSRVLEESPWSLANKNINGIPKELLLPTPIEIVQFQENIEKSLYIPNVNTIPRYGMKVSFGAIASLLGLSEDVTPEINYTLDYTTDVEIVVYSVQASVIRTIFKGIQFPGKYSVTWNFRDDFGKLVLKGDYVAEVRIGKERYVREHIVSY